MNSPEKIHELKTLFKPVVEAIQANPETFDMREWDCGTHACIAGHLARLAGRRNLQMAEIEYFAAGVLKMPLHVAGRLFFTVLWPREFNDPLIKAERKHDRVQMVAVTVARIQHFIETEE
jgi:hypothetical protein